MRFNLWPYILRYKAGLLEHEQQHVLCTMATYKNWTFLACHGEPLTNCIVHQNRNKNLIGNIALCVGCIVLGKPEQQTAKSKPAIIAMYIPSSNLQLYF